ncbi:MAG: ABC transporter permease [Acidobacteriaceae bacterium]|nr:ABC transporter permease [Acidobacteriaceae bacterium]MBV9779587.1 ABC transporter permease [Acidobacteriaceae bacterium]
MLQTLRFALRMLRKNPGFTLVAVCSLAIGIGANSAIFSWSDALLTRPLPVPRPSEVVAVRSSSPSQFSQSLSYRDYLDFRDRNKTFEGLMAYSLFPFGFAEKPSALAQVKYGMFVSGNFFGVLHVDPALGRAFRSDEDKVPGRDAVVVLSHDLWTSQFGSDPAAVGRKIRLNGTEFTIIGVAPEQFTGVDQLFRPAFYVPIAMASVEGDKDLLEKRDNRWLTVKGRLKPGITMPQAEADLTSIASALARMYPDTDRNVRARVETELQLRIEEDPPDSQLIAMLMTLAVCVLLVACANVAALLLSRSRARSREIAVRLAIGASRSRLIEQLLFESLLIALIGGGLGIAVAKAGIQLFNQITVPSDLPIILSAHLDQRVLFFTLAISVVSTILFGLTPAIRSTRPDLVPALKAGDSDTGGRRQRLWGRNSLVVAQVAISLVLLAVSTIMFRGFSDWIERGPGFRTERLLMMSFNPKLVRYNETQTQQFYKQLLERVRSAPQVKSAAWSSAVPMFPGQGREDVVPEGYQLPQGKQAVSVFAAAVSDGYFETIGIPILRGRGFLRTDTADKPLVAVVNEQFAKQYFPNHDAIGNRIHLTNASGPVLEVVGIAKTAKYLWIGESPTEYVYLPMAQHPQEKMTLIAQSEGDSASLTPGLRELVRGLDPNLPIYDVRTMDDYYRNRAVKAPTIVVQTVATMGLMGLVLAMIGLYGLVAYTVARRTREIGIRMAIGADRKTVLGSVLKQGLILGLAGIVIGVLGSVGADRVLGLMYGGSTEMSAEEALIIFLFMPLTFLAVTMLATYAPARRASLIDPMRALRDE